MWSYIAGGLKIKVKHRILPLGSKSSGLITCIIKGGLKIEGCKIEGLLYRDTRQHQQGGYNHDNRERNHDEHGE